MSEVPLQSKRCASLPHVHQTFINTTTAYHPERTLTDQPPLHGTQTGPRVLTPTPYSPYTLNVRIPGRTLPDIGAPHYIGVTHRVTYPY